MLDIAVIAFFGYILVHNVQVLYWLIFDPAHFSMRDIVSSREISLIAPGYFIPSGILVFFGSIMAPLVSIFLGALSLLGISNGPHSVSRSLRLTLAALAFLSLWVISELILSSFPNPYYESLRQYGGYFFLFICPACLFSGMTPFNFSM